MLHLKNTKSKKTQGLLPPIIVGMAIALSGCSTAGSNLTGSSDPVTTGSINGGVGLGSLRATHAARTAWHADRKNLEKGMFYVRQLQALEQHSEQLLTLEQLIKIHPTNTKLLTFYGKRLIVNGQSKEAVGILQQAEQRGEKDWRLYSALGSALDQTGRNREARQYYQRALKQNPGEVKVQNNMAMSHILEGQFSNAETILRKANNTPKGRALPRIRQNLALAVGLQGRFNEARQIASRDLPQAQVEANMAYLQKMLSRNNTWKKLQKS